jgi:hypothetical protein
MSESTQLFQILNVKCRPRGLNAFGEVEPGYIQLSASIAEATVLKEDSGEFWTVRLTPPTKLPRRVELQDIIQSSARGRWETWGYDPLRESDPQKAFFSIDAIEDSVHLVGGRIYCVFLFDFKIKPSMDWPFDDRQLHSAALICREVKQKPLTFRRIGLAPTVHPFWHKDTVKEKITIL